MHETFKWSFSRAVSDCITCAPDEDCRRVPFTVLDLKNSVVVALGGLISRRKAALEGRRSFQFSALTVVSKMFFFKEVVAGMYD